MFLSFTGIRHPVKLIDCTELVPLFSLIFRDFKVQKADKFVVQSVFITLSKTEQGYQRESLWLEQPVIHEDPVDAVCDFSVDLFHAFIGDHPGFLCLHSAAVKFDQGLVVFPSNYSTGKSILSLQLASMGMQLFTDDALPVTGNGEKGFAMGFLPRLRIPLPKKISSDFHDFVNSRAGLHNKRYCYVQLNREELSPFGTIAPISGIVLLTRTTEGDCKLEKVGKGEVIGEMILRNFARQNPAQNIVDRLCSIVENAACYRLTYGNLQQAAKLLIGQFDE